ncbi:MAG: tetratricopeptide repeat protein [Bacillota bacterium]|nr:tetratricopeptide repeat protein [Bacillota bacterium]
MSDFDAQLAEAFRLLEQGQRYLDARDFRQAEACFRASLAAAEIPAARNNWALCRHMGKDHQGTLEILTPLLQGSGPAPFSRALASRAWRTLGNELMARRFFKEAVRDFEAGLAAPHLRGGVSLADWLDYAVALEQAALELGDYRMALDLHNRLSSAHRPAQADFLAGIAAFNLRRYEQAVKYWRRVTEPQWVRPLRAFIQVAELCHQGVVPPLTLESEPAFGPPAKDPSALRELLRTKQSARLPILAAIFDPALEMPDGVLRGLIAETGDWGVELGRRVLQASRVPLDLKMEAAHGLVDVGVYAVDEPIPIIHEGQPTTVTIRQVALHGPDPELDRKVAEAKRLRDEGKKDEAYRMLSELELEGIAYPPAMVTLANLKRERGELEAARKTLEVLADAFPDDQVILFNLAALYLQKEDLERARQYAARLKPEGQSPEFQQRVNELLAYLSLAPGGIDPLALADSYRLEEEERALPVDITLKKALKALPVEWLNAIAAAYALPQVRRRPERERLVAETLADPQRLQHTLAAESPEVREALRLLLQAGGWCTLASLTERFGPLEGDGYWWTAKPPRSTVGRLRLLGLAFVGQTRVDGQLQKVAVVPTDLRPLLAGCL